MVGFLSRNPILIRMITIDVWRFNRCKITIAIIDWSTSNCFFTCLFGRDNFIRFQCITLVIDVLNSFGNVLLFYFRVNFNY